MMCVHCPNVAHNASKKTNCLGGAEQIDAEEDDYICSNCTEKNDSEFHENSCNDCNIFPISMAAVRRLLCCLGEMDHSNSPDVDRYLAARLDKYEQNIQSFIAHKIQDAHQTEALAEDLKNLGPDELLCWVDYAAKRMGLATLMMQQDGYGQGAGRLSHHISCIYQQARPCDAGGASSEDVDEMMLLTMHNTVTDNAQQGALAASMVTKFAIAQHRAEWASKPNPHKFVSARIRSDNAGDYTGAGYTLSMLVADTTEATGGVWVVSLTNSIAGEGKGTPDYKNGHNTLAAVM